MLAVYPADRSSNSAYKPVIPLDYVIALSAGARKLTDFISDRLFVHMTVKGPMHSPVDRAINGIKGLENTSLLLKLDQVEHTERNKHSLARFAR